MNCTKFDIVKKFIDEYDYLELLSSGCPSDEFDFESRYISCRITKEQTSEEIATIIAATFEKFFGYPEKSEHFLTTAQNIKEALSVNTLFN